MDCVCGSAFSQVVGYAPEGDAVGVGQIPANATDEDVITAITDGRHGVLAEVWVIENFDSRERFKQLSGFVNRKRSFGFNIDSFAVAIGDGDANAGWANLDRVIAEDFSGFKDHF